jgi:hypothetical protein
MKLKDLLFNREKLRKYDELKEWKENFSNMAHVPVGLLPHHSVVALRLPDHIKKTIISALEAEIAKLDEE